MSWHIAVFVPYGQIQKQVAKSSPENAKYHIAMPAIPPARAANAATHAWTKLYNEIMS